MQSRSIVVTGSIIVLAIIIFLAYPSFTTRAPTSTTYLVPSITTRTLLSGSVPTSNNSSGISAVLEQLIAGKFPTASDKHGTGGVTVTVRNLQVLYVRTESDGDWHVGVTDGAVTVFITEITPAYQESEGMPLVGSTIDETGVPYCDAVHETETWHGNTCWEIHPVTAWSPSNPTSSGNVHNQTIAREYKIGISYSQNPIPRGSTETITVQARDSDGQVGGATVSIEVDYASGVTVHNFSCITSSDGVCSISWEIGPSATPGTFNVIGDVGGQEFESTFSVVE